MALTDLADLVAEAAHQSGGRTALVEARGGSMTWGELEDEVARLATGLATLGVVAGRRVLLCLPNRREFVVAWLAVLRAQAVAVPVDPRSSPRTLARMLEDSGARVAIGDPASAEALRRARRDVGDESAPTALRLVLLDGSEREDGEVAYGAVGSVAAAPVPALPDPEKPAALLYTTDRAGQPRAAVLSHRALLANLDQQAALNAAAIGPEDVVLGALPLFHVYGLNAVLGTVLARHAQLVLCDTTDPEELLEVVERHSVTVLPVAPALIRRWLDREDLAERLHRVRLVMSGSAPLPAEVVHRFTELSGLTLHQGYGLTEAAPVVASTLTGSPAPAGSLGTPLPGIEVRLVDGEGDAPEPGDPGEIQLRGANLFSGYWPDLADGPDDEGWWSTGDIGFLADQGHLFLADRAAERVRVAGFSVYPREVAAVLSQVEGVREVGVMGVPDEVTGQSVVAFLVAPERDADEVADEANGRCAAELAGFKRPSRIDVVERLPRSATTSVLLA